MSKNSHFNHDEIATLDRAYINYEKFEELTDRNVVYVTKMKKNLVYDTLVGMMYQNDKGQMEYREQVVVFRKGDINHIFRSQMRGVRDRDFFILRLVKLYA